MIAIDIGGTKTLVSKFNQEGLFGKASRFPTPHDPQIFLTTISMLLKKLITQEKELIVIAAPGVIDNSTGTVQYSPNLGWKDFEIKHLLEQEVSCTVHLENDAHLAALGAVRRLQHIPSLALYVTIGTGIGSGIIVQGKLEPAFSRSEAGHMVFETSAGLATWESFASGKHIAATYGKLARDITDSKVWDEITDALVVGFRALIPALQPEIILIGGGVGVAFEQFASRLNSRLKEQLPDFIPVPSIIQTEDPDRAVLYGCYYYAYDSVRLPDTA